jgi:hypothetical protein
VWEFAVYMAELSKRGQKARLTEAEKADLFDWIDRPANDTVPAVRRVYVWDGMTVRVDDGN